MQLTVVTKELANTVKQVVEIQKAHTERITYLESRPGRNLINLKNTIVTAIVSACCGGIATIFLQEIIGG